jgi:hypothetical protein
MTLATLVTVIWFTVPLALHWTRHRGQWCSWQFDVRSLAHLFTLSSSSLFAFPVLNSSFLFFSLLSWWLCGTCFCGSTSWSRLVVGLYPTQLTLAALYSIQTYLFKPGNRRIYVIAVCFNLAILCLKLLSRWTDQTSLKSFFFSRCCLSSNSYKIKTFWDWNLSVTGAEATYQTNSCNSIARSNFSVPRSIGKGAEGAYQAEFMQIHARSNFFWDGTTRQPFPEDTCSHSFTCRRRFIGDARCW